MLGSEHSGVSEGKVFRRVLKGGMRQEADVTANVAWYAVKRCACQAGIANLAPHDLRLCRIPDQAECPRYGSSLSCSPAE
jgi:hypothetical protein